MAFNKRTWKGRQGTGLNKFSINGATPVTVINQPDSVTEQGDALSAGNLNDLEDRIDNAFEEIADGTQVVGKATADASGNVITDTYETKAEASDLKDAIQANSKRIENLEEKAGDYTEVDVKSVYSVPTGKAKNMVLVGLRGVSRARNQLQYNGQCTSQDGWQNGTVSDGYVTGSANANSYWQTYNATATPRITEGHFYVVSAKMTSVSGLASGNTSFNLRINGSSSSYNAVGDGSTSIANGASKVLQGVFTATSAHARSASSLIWGVYNDTNNFSAKWSDLSVRDLNVEFNTSDLSFLGATNSAKLATIQSSYPWLLLPSDYGTEMVKTRYESFTSVGVNIYDQEWVNGYYNSSGVLVLNSSYVSSKNMIPVVPSTSYYFKDTMNVAFEIFEYDVNGNFLRTSYTSVNNGSFNTSADCHYINFSNHIGGQITSYTTGIQICLNSYSDKTTFHEYQKHTLSLLTPIELGSAGSVAEEAYLNEDGQAWKTNPLGSVDLGTLTWTHYDGGVFYTSDLASVIQKPASSAVLGNYICASLTQKTGDDEWSNYKYNVAQNKNLWAKTDGSTTSPTTFASSLSGVYLDYELATPSADTPLTVLTDNWITTEGGGTLEAVKTYPIDDSFTVGYLTI